MKATKYYTIEGKPHNEVNPWWKFFHILLFSISFITCGIAAYCFGSVLNGFGFNCILYADIAFDAFTAIEKNNIQYNYSSIDLENTKWGSNSACDFCLFTLIILAIAAFMLATFFVINPRGGRGNPDYGLSPPWQIVVPSIILVTILCILMAAVIILLHGGLKYFCNEFEPVFGTTTCDSRINTYTLVFTDKIKKQHIDMMVTMYSYHIGVFSWLAQLALLITRMCIGSDFHILIITIKPKNQAITEEENDDEEVEEMV